MRALRPPGFPTDRPHSSLELLEGKELPGVTYLSVRSAVLNTFIRASLTILEQINPDPQAGRSQL